MKVSLNWVKEFTKVELPVEELVEKIGAQLGAVEEVINLGERYRGIIIVKVVECKPLEGSDHLSVCRVDDGGKVKDVERGEDGLVQVVCGAPNVREGMLVAWLPPAATVPSSWDGEHFVLEARKLRGVVSNGMLASARELAIGDSHEGLLELDEGQPGDDFAQTYKLDDYIIDIENKMFTHRPDCFGMLGIAREIAGITGQQFTSPAWYLDAPATTRHPELVSGSPAENTGIPKQVRNDDLKLEVRNELPSLVPRFMAVAISNVSVVPSQVMVQSYLSRVGIRPINNIVDVTNYMMVLTGQPLHAYDYDKVKALSGGDKAIIVIRNPHNGEKLTLLNGKEVQPRAEGVVIATDEQAIGLGGVMGGAETEVGNETKNIILECAAFDMYSIRRTSMAHGLFSDAVTRYTKGQSPLQNDRVITESARTICELGAGEFASRLIDDSHLEKADIERGNVHPAVTVSVQYINDRLGLQLAAKEIQSLLQHVEFSVEADGDNLTVQAPFWRTDIELREDVVEEVGRLYGYDHLPLELPRRSIEPAAKDTLLETKARVRGILSKAGANEVLTYSFVHGNLLEKAGQNKEDAFELGNALSPDLQYYRLSLTPSLLEKVHPNIKAGYDEFALFEIGKAHIKGLDEGDEVSELEHVGLVFAAAKKAAGGYEGAAYYQARKYLMNLLAELGLAGKVRFEPLDPKTYAGATRTQIPYYEASRTAAVILGDVNLGEVGEYKPSVRTGLKLPALAAGFELDLGALATYVKTYDKTYVTLPKYPKVSQDISLKVPAALSYQELFDFVWNEIGKVQPENTFPSLAPLDIYQGEDAQTKNITLRFSIASYEKTLTDQEVNKLLDAAAAAAKTKFGAERI